MSWDAAPSRPVPIGGLLLELDPAVAWPSALLRVAGELDPATTPMLSGALLGLVDDGCSHVDVDLALVRFCDSAGLFALVEARERLREQGGTLAVHDPCRSLQLLLEIFALSLTLDGLTPTPADAAAPPRPPTLPTSRLPTDG